MIGKHNYIAALALALVCAATAAADVKIKSKQTVSGQSYENTTYIKGKRQRSETMNGMMVSLTQCDLRRGVQINPNTRTYMLNPFNTTVETVTKPASTTVDKNGVVQSGGTITMTITTKDTGERKQMFGYTARRLIITMEMSSSADACTKSDMKTETDGWYIDFETQFDCGDSVNYGNYRNPNKPTCQDRYVTKNLGSGKRGYPVYEKMTMFDRSGKEISSYVTEVVELSKATLDPALFEVPTDYREVSDASQMYAGPSASPSGSNGSMGSSLPAARGSSIGLPSTETPSTTNSNVLAGANTNAAAPTQNLGPKKAGVLRIGLASVKTGAVGDGIAAADLAAAVQNSLRDFLKVPNLEIVVLEAKLASAIDSEAKSKECDMVLFANVSHKKGGGGFGMFKAVAPVLSSVVPMAGMAGMAGAVAGSVASSAIMTASVSGNMKAKDELTLDVKLDKIGGANALTKQIKVKAKSNGEDIIAAAVEQAAQAVVDTVGK